MSLHERMKQRAQAVSVRRSAGPAGFWQREAEYERQWAEAWRIRWEVDNQRFTRGYWYMIVASLLNAVAALGFLLGWWR